MPQIGKGRQSRTVEPPNNGQVGTWPFVHYSEVVLYWGVFILLLIQVSTSLRTHGIGLNSSIIMTVGIKLMIV